MNKKIKIFTVLLMVLSSISAQATGSATSTGATIPPIINNIAIAGARAANHQNENGDCVLGTELDNNRNICVYKKQGPFPQPQTPCTIGHFNYFKNLPETLKKDLESNFKEWQEACKSLASCKNASEMTWHVSLEIEDSKVDVYSCIPKTCLNDFPKKESDKCYPLKNGDECTPSDTNAKKATWNDASKTCTITECASNKFVIQDNKCIKKSDVEKQKNKEKKEQTALEKKYNKDIDALVDAYNTATKKLISECVSQGNSIEECK